MQSKLKLSFACLLITASLWTLWLVSQVPKGKGRLIPAPLNFNPARCDAWHGAMDAWYAWDGCVLGSDGRNQCEWAQMVSGPKMCCRTYHNAVDDIIKRDGVWGDCPELVSWWTFLQDRSGQGGAGHNKFYVDIGANIGSCLLLMMAQPGVQKCFAFEPNPANLFYLTHTILANPDIREKVKLYPIALGDEDQIRPIYMEEGNAGNTVVGQAVHASASAVGEVKIKRLDDVLMKGTTPPYIHLMKMDAQGYEVKIMKGASKLFASGAVNAVKIELATDWLVRQNTSSAEFLNTFMNYGFQFHDSTTKQLVSQERLHSVACGPPIVEDFVAVRPKAGEVATQKPIVCIAKAV